MLASINTRKRHFYRNLIKLALPMGLTSLLGSLLNMIDTFMITNLGDHAVAAVGSANKLFFIMIVTLYGVYSGLGVFVSQYWGKKDYKRIQTIYMIAITTGIIISSIVTLISWFKPEFIISLFSDDPLVIDSGVKYLRIVSWSFVLSAILFSIEMVSRSTENVKLPMFVSAFGIIFNAVLNYILIFGIQIDAFVIEPRGVEGAALATVLARILQLLIYIVVIIVTKNKILLLKISNFVFEAELFKKMFLKTVPVVMNEGIWSLGIVSITIAYGKLGTQALASLQLFDTIVGLLTVFTWGIANSAGIMLGKKIGEKNMDDVDLYTKLFIKVAIIFGLFTGVIIASSTPLIPIFLDHLSKNVINNIQNLLLVFSLFMPIKLLAATFIVGILRSGGDTLYALAVEAGCLWGYAVPVAFTLVLLTPLTLPLVYFFVSLEEVLKDFLCYIRYKKGKHLHNLIH